MRKKRLTKNQKSLSTSTKVGDLQEVHLLLLT